MTPEQQKLFDSHIAEVGAEIERLNQLIAWHRQEVQRTTEPHVLGIRQAEARLAELKPYHATWQASLNESPEVTEA